MKAAAASLGIIASALLLLLVLGPLLATHPPARSVAPPFASPSVQPPFGADALGRDVWSEVAHGASGTVLLPLAATALATLIGGCGGLLVGASRTRAADALLRAIDALLAVPPLIVLVVLVSGWGGGPRVLALAVVLASAPFILRVTALATAQAMASGYVEAARASGDGVVMTLRREVVPQVAGIVLAEAGVRLGGAIYLVAAASFLGIGGDPDVGRWATMIRANLPGASLNPWAVIVPALLLALLVAGTNLALDRWQTRSAR